MGLHSRTFGSTRLVLSSEAVDEALEARLPAGSRDLVRTVRESTRSSTGDIAAALGVSRPVTLRLLRALADEGVIVWVGKSPKDPRAYWRLGP